MVHSLETAFSEIFPVQGMKLRIAQVLNKSF